MKKLAIGVDIGGINTAFGLVDENGDLYAESVISTKKYPHVDDYPAYVEDLTGFRARSVPGNSVSQMPQ